jgi:hypothetical protein
MSYGREAGRPPVQAPTKVRAHDQSQDREGARSRGAAYTSSLASTRPLRGR